MAQRVTKSTTDVYRIVNDHEHATVVVQGWQTSSTGKSPRVIEQGEILVHSSHGSWGYQWANMGVPIKQFLMGASFDCLMTKLLPNGVREFDFEASLLTWKRHLVAARRTRQLSCEDMREIWDGSTNSNRCGIDMFLHRIEQAQPLGLRNSHLWDRLDAYVVNRNNPAAVSFWCDLWPLFIEKLQSELVAANDPRLVAA